MIENNLQRFFTENTIYYKKEGEVKKNHNHEGNQKKEELKNKKEDKKRIPLQICVLKWLLTQQLLLLYCYDMGINKDRHLTH